jgi:hypothetical protein
MQGTGQRCESDSEKPLIGDCYIGDATSGCRGDSVQRRIQASVLLAMIVITALLAQTITVSGNAATSGSESIASCRIPLPAQNSNKTNTEHQPPPGNTNQTGPPLHSQTHMSNQTGFKPRTPPGGTNQTGNVNPPPMPRTANQTNTHPQPPPSTANQPPQSEPSWIANLTAEQKQTLDQTVKKMQASGETPQQIWKAVSELLAEWGVPVPRCP